MKNRLLCFVTSLIVIISILPICVSAAGGYYVIKGERTYHNVFCEEVTGYYIEDLKWYPTLAKVKSAGFKPGTCCEDSGIDYEQDGATAWFSKDQKTQNAMELERFMGILDSVELIEEEKDAAYDSGYEIGYDIGYDEGHDDGYDEGRDSAEPSDLEFWLTIGIPLVIGFLCGKQFTKTDMESELKEAKHENIKLKATLSQYKSRIGEE
mgnify:CR=1 FL=1